jgi:hypothetical protein
MRTLPPITDLTMRDFFASQVVADVFVGFDVAAIIRNGGDASVEKLSENAALFAYKIADAMIRERAK